MGTQYDQHPIHTAKSVATGRELVLGLPTGIGTLNPGVYLPHCIHCRVAVSFTVAPPWRRAQTSESHCAASHEKMFQFYETVNISFPR